MSTRVSPTPQVASVPLSLPAAYAPSRTGPIVARILGGVTGRLCYPTTPALIAALRSGPARTRPIALWSAIGASSLAALGPLL
jgi:MFS family permease